VGGYPELVAATVARTLGIGEPTGRPITETLPEALRERELLLILDNCEHLLAASAALASRLLSACPHLRVLATSRQSLGIAGEIVWTAPPLSLPPDEGVGRRELGVGYEPSDPTPDTLAQYEAIRLFVERGRAASRHFALTTENMATVVQVCRRLDGMPLALELAAARLRALPVEQLAARLDDDRFRFLTGGNRAALPRHQTLRNALDWSFDLLDEPERLLLRRLSIFAGGFTLQAAETVCGDGGVREGQAEDRTPNTEHRDLEVLDLLTALVDKTLVQLEVGGRYRLLETVREYARERLREAEELEVVAQRHALWAVALAEQGEAAIQGPAQIAWLDRLAEEIDNFRAALEWSLSREEGELAGRLAGALARFFHWRGYVIEGSRWLERALGARPAASAATRAKLLCGAAVLWHEQAEVETARRHAEECLVLWQQVGDQRGVAEALEQLGHIVNLAGDYARATELFEESLAVRRAIGDRAGTAAALNALGYMAWFYGDRERAAALCEESLQLRREEGDSWGAAYSLEFLGLALLGKGDAPAAMRSLEECLRLRRQLGDKRGIAAALMQLGYAASSQHDLVAAQGYFEESLPLWRELHNPDGAATVLTGLAMIAREQGAFSRAMALFRASLSTFSSIDHHSGMAECLDGMARTAGLMGDFRWSACFGGLAERILEEGQVPIKEGIRRWLDAIRSAAAAAMDEEGCSAAWNEGRAMSVEQALVEAGELAGHVTSI
jgi:predicted ATPase